MTAVALLSGGLDSTVATTATARDGEVVLALTVDYRQRALQKEVLASRAIAKELGIKHRVVRLDFLGEIANSSLVERGRSLPEIGESDLDDVEGAARDSMRDVWVPNRNGLMIAVAGAFAESLGAAEIVVGFNREEAATFPDNSGEFLEAANQSLGYSTLRGVQVVSPTLSLDKEGIIRLGYDLEAPMRYVWSCYEGRELHCWRCESCLRLRRALEASSFRDRFEEEWIGGSE